MIFCNWYDNRLGSESLTLFDLSQAILALRYQRNKLRSFEVTSQLREVFYSLLLTSQHYLLTLLFQLLE